MPFLTVIGHTNIDVQLHVATMPGGGRSSPVQRRETVYGGTACNIARHASGLGVPTRLWSRVGDDFPTDWREALEEDGVELRFDTPTGALTPTCFILQAPDGEHAFCMDQAAMRPPYDVPDAILDGTTWLHVCTGDPHSYFPLVEEAKKQGILVAFDPGQEIHFAYDEKTFFQMMEAADVMFLNHVELEKAFGFCSYGDPAQFLDHVDVLVVTRGEDGADLWTDAGKVHVDAHKVDVVDHIGAGDGLRAGWYAALHQGKDFGTALRNGVAAAAAVVGMKGPQPHALRPDDLQ